MTESTTELRVTVAPGTGRVARRTGSLLFDPSGENGDLIAAFDAAATDAAAVVAVKRHLIDSGFEAAPVVVIEWRSEGLALLVFGDVSVQTSAAAAPNISGAGSGTWIERHLGALELGDAADVQLWCGDETDEATNLQLGHVRAGGVRLGLTRADRAEPQSEVPTPASAVPEADVVEEVVEEVEVRRPVPEVEAESLNPRPVPSPVPAGAVAAAVAAPAPSTNGSGAYAGSPAPSSVGEMPAADPFADSSQAPAEPLHNSVTEPLVRASDKSAPVAAGLVEAIMCSNGHSNPEGYTTCRACAVEISADAAVVLVAQPTVGHLRFTNGDVVEVNDALLIGRKPVTDSEARPVTVDHAEVSRSHVKVTIDGWSVLVTDRGSRNGTWVVPPSDPTPVKLEAQVPYLLEHGTTVHLGGPEASFAYDFGTD